MAQTLILLWMVLAGPLVLFFIYRVRVAGRILCVILEQDRSVKTRLIKVEGDFLDIDDGQYLVNPDAVRLMRYPSGWPVWLQQIVPTCLYRKDEVEPLDWNTQVPITSSASALAAVMEPEWIKLIVSGTKEGSSSLTGGRKVLTMIGLGASIVSLVMAFYIITKLGAIETLVKSVGG